MFPMKSSNQFLACTLMFMIGADQLSNAQPDKSAVIMAQKSLTDCTLGNYEKPMDVYKNLVLVKDSCAAVNIVEISAESDFNVTTRKSLPSNGDLPIKFDKFGFIVSIVAADFSRPFQATVTNQSIGGFVNWQKNITGYTTFFMGFDQSNQVNIATYAGKDKESLLFYTLTIHGNQNSFFATHDQSLLDLSNLITAASVTPDGNWIIASTKGLYHYGNRTVSRISKTTRNADVGEGVDWIYIINEKTFFAPQKIQPSSANQLELYKFNTVHKNWTKSSNQIQTTSNIKCSHFSIVKVNQSETQNLLTTCVTAPADGELFSILAYSLPSLGSKKLGLSEIWVSNTSLGAPDVVWVDSLPLIRGIVKKKTMLEGWQLDTVGGGWYWLMIYLKYDNLNQGGASGTTSQPTPIQTASTSLRRPVRAARQESDSIYIISGVSMGLVSIILFILMAIYIKKRRSASYKNSADTPSHIRDVKAATMSSITIGTMSARTFNSMFTLNSGQKEFSIPGYLLVNVDKDVLMQQKIAAGGMGVVYLASIQNPALLERCQSNTCVVKVLTTEIDDRELAAFRQEVAIMSFFQKHSNFAQIVGYADQPTPVILMKHYPLGSLANWIQKENVNIPYSSRVVLRFASNIISGILSMHRANLVHCDIKPANVLINQNPQHGLCAVLTDFGITRILDTTMLVRAFQVMNKNGWSLVYCPPEAFKSRFKPQNGTPDANKQSECNQQILKSTDVYMFGMSAYEMISRKAPFNDMKDAEKVIESIWIGERPSIDWDLMKADPILGGLADVVVQCWNQAPESRPQPQDLVETLKQLKICDSSPASTKNAP